MIFYLSGEKWLVMVHLTHISAGSIFHGFKLSNRSQQEAPFSLYLHKLEYSYTQNA